MATQGPRHPPQPAGWDPDRLAASLAIAHRYARRGARRLGLSRSDHDDLRQDILLAILERDVRFDPERAHWDAFATLLARHVVADRVRLRRAGVHPEHVHLDLDGFPVGASVTQRDEVDHDLRLDLARVGADMPAPFGRLLALLRGTADIADAQRQAPESALPSTGHWPSCGAGCTPPDCGRCAARRRAPRAPHPPEKKSPPNP